MAPAPAVGRLPSGELLLLRHAEAERKAATDFDRPLTRQGQADAAAAGRRLAGCGLRPDLVLSSPAPRARETARLAAAAWPDLAAPREVRGLYDADGTAVQAAIAREAGAARRLLVVGHNPGLSELAAWLASLPAGWSLSKAATAHLRVRAGWDDLSRGCGRLVDVLEEV